MEKNQGYAILKAVMLENGRGFALGGNPAAPSPFVTWQFTEEQGQRDYYWGRYFNTEAEADKSFIDRTNDYERQYGAKIVSVGPRDERYQYYSTQRPVDLGTYPKSTKNPMMDFTNYDKRIPVENGAFLAWGYLIYGKPLTEKQASDYELHPAKDNPDIRREVAVKRPIAEQIKTAAKLAEENRGNPAPKKDALDKGGR